MEKTKEINWGIIGCGDVCERKSGPPMYLTEHSHLKAVMRRDAAKAADFARRHGAARSYSDAARLIADPEVDIVYIATPHASHRELTLQTLAAGKPVYVEKPMGMNHAECAEMLAAARRARQPLFVAYYRRALPYFLQVKELLDGGAIGTPQTVEVRLSRCPSPADGDAARRPWRLCPQLGGDGYFYDLAPHQLDILDFLLGPVAAAAGCKSNRGGLYEAADTVAASLRFESGVVGSGIWNFVAPADRQEDTIRITGSGGSVRFGCFDMRPIEVVAPTAVRRYDIAPPRYIQQPLIRTIVAELRGEGHCPSTGVTAARTSRIMDLIMQA